MPFVALTVQGVNVTTDASGRFTATGRFGAGRFTMGLIYDSRVVTGSTQTRLQIMDEVQASRSDAIAVNASASEDPSVIELGPITLKSVDCEIWRISAAILGSYHTMVGKSPPAGQLRLKRWSGIWDGTPHTYYDYIVLNTNWGTKAPYDSEWSRKRTLNHEFGHSIRHVADGDELHRGWDNFRWVYARNHSGCEIFNTQYAFNEGWGGYWQSQAGFGLPSCSPATPIGNRDWNDSLVGEHLRDLADDLCTPSNPGQRARKMVEVLERFPGEIHSLWDFVQRYCRLHFAGNPNCSRSGVPARATPKSCPPDFHDDGATCRYDNIRAKPSYGRGVGVPPTVCASGHENDAGLCYKTCRAGYGGAGPVCWERCASGYRDPARRESPPPSSIKIAKESRKAVCDMPC